MAVPRRCRAIAAPPITRAGARQMLRRHPPGRNRFRREGEYWTVRYEGSVARLKDAKGPRYLAQLLGHPGREFHAVDLAAAGGQARRPAPSAAGDAARAGGLRVR